MKKIVVVATLLLSWSQAHALDVYIGTIETRNGKAHLIRCDLVKNEYILTDVDKSANGPVKRLMDKFGKQKPPIYAEVIGDYQEKDGKNILVAKAIQNIKQGKSCHLL